MARAGERRTVMFITSSMATTAGPGALREAITEKFLSASRVAATCRVNKNSLARVMAEGEELEGVLDETLDDIRHR